LCWVPGLGRDVVVVVSLREQSFENRSYNLGFPQPGGWYEVFNSDVYDYFPNSSTHGNGGQISADGPMLHGLPCSAAITIPANGLLVFARDTGD
jgi:1,4-alpha-glucan branching enzyme